MTNRAHTGFFGLISLLLLIHTSTSNAQTPPIPTNSLKTTSHNHQAIIDTAENFLKENIDLSVYSRVDISMGRLDSRLRLAHCNTPLTSNLAQGSQLSGKTTVHIRCNGTTPWTVYLSARISLFTNVVTTIEPMDKEHILTESDLTLSEKNLNTLQSGYFTNTDSLIGKQLKRRLAQNKVLKGHHVKSPTLVKRGERVSIIAENAGYSVKMTGKALSSGALGDRIRVKNLSSRRIIEGTVKKSGIVSIN